jgi:hypothetical protein
MQLSGCANFFENILKIIIGVILTGVREIFKKQRVRAIRALGRGRVWRTI